MSAEYSYSLLKESGWYSELKILYHFFLASSKCLISRYIKIFGRKDKLGIKFINGTSSECKVRGLCESQDLLTKKHKYKVEFFELSIES